MRNVTLTLPESVYRRARIAAAERDLSLSGLVRELLSSLVSRDSEFERLRKLQDEAFAEIGEFRASERLNRDELYSR